MGGRIVQAKFPVLLMLSGVVTLTEIVCHSTLLWIFPNAIRPKSAVSFSVRFFGGAPEPSVFAQAPPR
jgi:hypothetical protein